MHATTTDRAFDRFDVSPPAAARAPSTAEASSTDQLQLGTIFFGGFFLLIALVLWGIDPTHR